MVVTADSIVAGPRHQPTVWKTFSPDTKLLTWEVEETKGKMFMAR